MMREFLGIPEAGAVAKDLTDQRTQLANEFLKRRALLILDDVWNITFKYKQMIEWLDVAKGARSVTLVTTRELEVLKSIHAQEEEMPLLSTGDSWKLFSSHAFPKDLPRLEVEIEDLAKDVCNECKCLPLALKVVGFAMRGKSEIEEWRSALRHLRDSRPLPGCAIEHELYGRLRLSYEGLVDGNCRSVLQKCFLFCAAFLEDSMIPAQTLCKLWISEDVFEDGIDGKDAWDEARYALKVLSMRSFVEVDGSRVEMHDILRDLAIYLFRRINTEHLDSTQEHLFKPILDLKRLQGGRYLTNLKVKRMSLVFNYERQYRNYRNAPDHMRTCLLESHLQGLISPNHPMGIDFLNVGNLHYLEMTQMSGLEKLPESIIRLKFLKFLDLSSCEALKELPQRIGDLRALRHLNLGSCKALEELHETIGDLQSLEHLHLFYCRALKALPKTIGNLQSLRTLDIQGCLALKGLPGTIRNLQSIEIINVRGRTR